MGVKKYIKYRQEEDKASQSLHTCHITFKFRFHRNLLKGGIYISSGRTIWFKW